ncbi:phosphatase and actin regulator 2 isoform X2 [Pristis pectinata]|uniref:phosphatase and actin regulator 2 isoform X2 n=1 Tax=Pristis pectinata TaxID=685728 RepID=UPI00223D078F|nr:phosphatase and actin regulator 2 isoform X2 [Pristis pectinata]
MGQSASGDSVDSPPTASPDGPLAVPGTPPLKRKSKLASITNIFKPWKWRKKKPSEKFQETSALLERKISTRQSREELVRRGVLKEDPEQAGSSEVTITNGHTIHAIPIRIQPAEGSTLEAVSTDTTLPQETGMSEQSPPYKVGSPQGETQPSLPGDHPDPTAIGAAQNDDLGTMTSPPALPKPTNRGSNAEHASFPSEKLSSSASAPQSPPSLQPMTNTNLPWDTSGSLGTGDSLTEAARHPDFSSQPSPELPSKSGSCGPLVDSPPPPHLLDDGAEIERSQDVAQSDPKQETDAPSADSTHRPQRDVTDGKMDVSLERAGTEQELKRGGAVEAGSNDLAGEDPEGVTERVRVLLGAVTSVVVIPHEDVSELMGSESGSDAAQCRNDSDEEDDEESLNSALATKIRRRDTLATKLRNRPSKQELEEKNILPRTSSEEWSELRQQIGNKLIRRLSQRPSLEELEQRNILRYRNEEEEHEERLEIRRRLTRKLSLRPTVAELQARRILRFNEYVEVTEAQDYDRRADKPWTRLTPADKAAIRKELNEFKSREMEVHEESRHLTRFHRP